MASTHTQQLNILSLPPEACTQHLFPEMKTTGLLSIGQLCNYGCTAKFSKRRLIIRNSGGNIILIGHLIPQGDRQYTNGMRMVQLKEDTPPVSMMHPANEIILADTTKADLARLHDTSLGFPTLSTFCDAIEVGFLS